MSKTTSGNLTVELKEGLSVGSGTWTAPGRLGATLSKSKCAQVPVSRGKYLQIKCTYNAKTEGGVDPKDFTTSPESVSRENIK